MTNITPPEGAVKAPLSVASIIIIAGAVSLLGLTAVAAFFNAAGWLHRSLAELAAFAVVTEFIALLMAACAEYVWERKKLATALRALAIGVLLVSAIGCEAFNGFGAFQAWQDTVAERAETLVAPQRNAIAAAETRLRAGIEAAQARIDAVQRPNCEGLGPLTCASRTDAWQAQTELDRADLAAKQREFDALDRTVEMPAPPFPDSVVVAFLAFIGFVKVAGPWAISQAFQRSMRPKVERKAEPRGTEGNVIPFPRGDEGKRLVRALRASGLSFRDIERRYGVPIATAHRLSKA